MSDNEDEVVVSENEASDSGDEASVRSEDLIDDAGSVSGNESENESEDEKSESKKPKKKETKPKPKPKDDVDEDDVDEIDAEDEEEEIEIDFQLIEKAQSISQKTGIIVDPRSLDLIAKPGHKIKREIIVSRDKYKSSEYLQLYEFCDLVGVRAEHISQGADVYIEIESETTAREIAKKELQMGRCPYLIKRYMTPMNFDPVYVEIWNPNDMAINPKFFNN
jgi:DNA-directed RNA polymerase subunit K/omega